MKKTVIVGDCQVILEGTLEEIMALERLQEQKQTIYNIHVYVNGEDVNKKELEDRLRKAIAETDKRLWDKERLR
ncbi:hypothetical protein [Geobacillus sp. CCR]